MFMQQVGAFEVHKLADPDHGKVLQHVVLQAPIHWCLFHLAFPVDLVGNYAWYAVCLFSTVLPMCIIVVVTLYMHEYVRLPSHIVSTIALSDFDVSLSNFASRSSCRENEPHLIASSEVKWNIDWIQIYFTFHC